MRKFIYTLLGLVWVLSLDATVVAKYEGAEIISDKAYVRLQIQNEGVQSISAMRLWLFALDESGRVIGQKAQWVDQLYDSPLSPNSSCAIILQVPTGGVRPHSYRVINSRTVYESGMLGLKEEDFKYNSSK